MDNQVSTDKQKRIAYIKCCLCGLDFDPHEFKQKICKKCSQQENKIEDIIWCKRDTIELCKHCLRYNKPPFMNIARESPEMLGLLLKRIQGLEQVKVVEAKQLWTEEHSRRLQLMVIFSHQGVEDSRVFIFVEHAGQCQQCQKEYTPHKWNSQIQLRQKGLFAKTLAKLEQKLLQNKEIMKQNTVVEKVTNGLDIQFQSQKDSQTCLQYIRSLCVYRLKQSKQLISKDNKSNTQHYKYTSLIELPTLCKHDLIILSPQLSTKLGGCSPLMLCFQLDSNVKLVDPLQNRVVILTSQQYFQIEPEVQLLSLVDNATELLVVSIDDPLSYNYNNKIKGRQNPNDSKVKDQTTFSNNSTQKYINIQCCDVTVVDAGGQLYTVCSHLGLQLKCGDCVLAYHLDKITQLEEIHVRQCPQVILVKKVKDKKHSKKH